MLIFLKKYGVNLGCAALVFSLIYYFFDARSFSWQALGVGFLLYSLLSLITGLRFYCWLRVSTQLHLKPTEIISIPARMNLFSYILPFKGGGIWLMWYLKTRYQLAYGTTLGLAFQNALLTVSLLIVLIISEIWRAETVWEQFVWIAGVLLLLNLILWPIKHRLQHNTSLPLLVGDTMLCLLYLLITCLLPMLLLDISAAKALIFASLILTSSLVKLTPANIGVLEGMAMIAGYWFQDPGFIQFVAFFRMLSLLHAATFGLGSLLLNRCKEA